MQIIKFECHNPSSFHLSDKELDTVHKIARLFAFKRDNFTKNLRVVIEEHAVLKVYIGDEYQEEYRVWVDRDGEALLLETDISLTEGDWHPVSIQSSAVDAVYGIMSDRVIRKNPFWPFATNQKEVNNA